VGNLDVNNNELATNLER